MSFNHKLILLLLFLCLTKPTASQSVNYQGAPYIENFDPNDNMGGKFIWDICQDDRGVIFLGDREGVIEYDGTSWRRHPVPNRSVVKSVVADSTGTIYVGGNNDFGYMKPDSLGVLKYRSLNHLVPGNTPYYRSVWKIFITPQGIYYICQNRIFRLINDTVEVITANLEPPCAAYANGTIYVADKDMGMAIIDGNRLVPSPYLNKIYSRKKGYFFVNSYSSEEVIVSFSKTKQFYRYNPVTHKITPVDLPEATSNYLIENFGLFTLPLENGKTAISTSRGGIAILNKNWEIIRVINENRGLVSNTVYSLFMDKEKNMWAGHRKGISRIDLSYPATFFRKKQGLEADITCSTVHNGTQYIGTDNKCYYLPPYKFNTQNDNHQVSEIEELHDCHQFINVNGHLLVCNWMALSEINQHKAKDIYNKQERAYCAAYDKQYPDKIALGQNGEVVICTFKDPGPDQFIELTDTFEIKNELSQIRSMVFDNQGNLWLASYNEGISLIRFKNKNLKEYTITRFSEKNGLPHEIQDAYVDKFDGKINIFTPKGIYKTAASTITTADSAIQFVHDSSWGNTFTKDSCGVKIAKQISPSQFFIYGDKTGILTLKEDSAIFDYKPFLKLNDIRSVSIEDNRYINIGGVDYFCVYDSFEKKNTSAPFKALIRRVAISPSDSLLFGGAYLNGDKTKVDLFQSENYIPSLKNKYNSLRFKFSANFLESPHQNQYRYRIDGFNKHWSTWSTEPTATYTNIPYGTHTFKVMAKNIYGETSPISTYEFNIEPAWHQTIWAYLLYILLSAVLISLIAKLYNRTLSKQNNKLENLVKIRTSELQDTITQLKETQSNLVQQEKMASLGILTAGVAHEINNPLNYIQGGYTGLQSYFEDKSELDEDIEVLMYSIKTGVERAAEIVSGLNQFSRTKNNLDEKCDIHSILDNSILMIQHLLKNKIQLIKHYNAASYCVTGNVGKLHQVFINIFINACQAIADTGTITVITSITDEQLTIEISDTGDGMENDLISKITDPFFTTKEAGKGSGLGLYITYKIIQEHHGKLSFESKKGQGTKVLISIPLD